MGTSSEPTLLTLHALRLKGFIDSAEVAEIAALDQSVVDTELAKFVESGHVVYRDGRVSGWSLTPEGRVHGEKLLSAELDAADVRDQVADSYQQFLGCNQDFLSICTDWQVRTVDGEQQLNDHDDPEYDASVIAALAAIDGRVQPVVAQLASQLDRFGSYGGRFTDRLGRVNNGETDWFTKPMIDSYHTVWFELHENLLATLGIERAKEGH